MSAAPSAASDVVLFGLAMAGLFHYVPNTHVRWRHALIGGAFVSIGFSLAKSLLAWYVKQVPTYSTLYGAFATVPILLIWIYLGWVIVLLGAILAANTPSLIGRLHLRPDCARPADERLRWRRCASCGACARPGSRACRFLALASVRCAWTRCNSAPSSTGCWRWTGSAGWKRRVPSAWCCCVTPERSSWRAPLITAFLAEREGLLANLWAHGEWTAAAAGAAARSLRLEAPGS